MSKEERAKMKIQIEKMDKEQQIEVLRKLVTMTNVNLNENINGTFINLSELTEEQVSTLKSYISYVHVQEANLTKVENKKKHIQQSYFNGNKEMSNIIL